MFGDYRFNYTHDYLASSPLRPELFFCITLRMPVVYRSLSNKFILEFGHFLNSDFCYYAPKIGSAYKTEDAWSVPQSFLEEFFRVTMICLPNRSPFQLQREILKIVL